MIKYALIKNNIYFFIPGCINPTCSVEIKSTNNSIVVKLILDKLNTCIENNVGLYRLKYKQIELFKLFLLHKENNEINGIVSFTKEYDDYLLPPMLIEKDMKFISDYLSDQFKRRKSLSSKNTNTFVPKVYHLPSELNEGIKRNGVPLVEISETLGFDTEAFIKPKTINDLLNSVIEASRLVREINDELDEKFGWNSREDFSVNTHKFTQYLDSEDNAHILYFDPEIKKQILNEKRIDLNPWVEIFTIDNTYCYFKNKQGVVIGRIKLKSCDPFKWCFVITNTETIKANLKITEFNCIGKTPCECEREVIKWLIENNLFDELVNKNV